MIELMKKNIPLLVTLVVSIVASAVLLFFVLNHASTIKEYQKQLTEDVNKIKELAETTPPKPVRENLMRIDGDVKKAREYVDKSHLIFGKPYRKALQVFAEQLGEDENKITSRWKSIYGAESRKGQIDEQIFQTFMSKYTAEQADAAKNAFKDEVLKRSVEPISTTTINSLIMESMGVPRNMTSEECVTYVKTMINELDAMLLDPKIGKGVSISCTDKAFLSVYQNKLPLPVHIPFIIKHYKMIEDVLFRLKETGVTGLKSLSKANTLDGTTDKGHLYFTYKMSITGSLDSVRSFINSLIDSYDNNRIYVIKNLSLKLATDEIEKLEPPSSKPGEDEAVKDDNPFRPEPGKENDAQKDDNSEFGESFEENPIIIGTNDSREVVVDLTFDYVIYIDDELRR